MRPITHQHCTLARQLLIEKAGVYNVIRIDNRQKAIVGTTDNGDPTAVSTYGAPSHTMISLYRVQTLGIVSIVTTEEQVLCS